MKSVLLALTLFMIATISYGHDHQFLVVSWTTNSNYHSTNSYSPYAQYSTGFNGVIVAARIECAICHLTPEECEGGVRVTPTKVPQNPDWRNMPTKYRKKNDDGSKNVNKDETGHIRTSK